MRSIKEEYYYQMLGLLASYTYTDAENLIKDKGMDYVSNLLKIDPYIEALANIFNKYFLNQMQLTKEDLVNLPYLRELELKDEFYFSDYRDDTELYHKRVLEMTKEFHNEFIMNHKYTGDAKYGTYFVTSKNFDDLTYEEFLFELTFVNILVARLGGVLSMSLNKFTSYGKFLEPNEKLATAFKNSHITKKKFNEEYYDSLVTYGTDEGWGVSYVSEIDMEKYDADTFIARKEYGGLPFGYISYVFNEEDCKLKTLHFKSNVQILDECFENAKELETIICEGEITKVMSQAFQNSDKLKTIYEGIVYLKVNDNPYYICSGYAGGKKNVKLHPDCVVVQDYALSETDIEGIDFSNVKYIGTQAVSYCNNLKVLIMSDSVVSLGEYGLAQDCKSLCKIILSNSLKKIECTITSENEALREITLPSKLETVGTSLFYNCSNLTDIKFPETCKKYGWFAISNCPKVKKVYIPKGSDASKLSFENVEIVEY